MEEYSEWFGEALYDTIPMYDVSVHEMIYFSNKSTKFHKKTFGKKLLLQESSEKTYLSQ